jgi:WD40 repeat protein
LGFFKPFAFIWDLKDHIARRDIEVGKTSGLIALSPDGNELVVRDRDERTRIWDVHNEKCFTMLVDQRSRGAMQSIACSTNGSQVIASFYDGSAIIWNMTNPIPFKTLDIGAEIEDISFDATDSYVFTDIGIVPIDTSVDSRAVAAKFPHRCYGLSSDRVWITWNGRKVLWLPSEYRPVKSRVGAWTIVGCSAGRVVFLRFSQEKAPYDRISSP